MLLPAILTSAGLALLLLAEWRGLLVLRALGKSAAAGGFVWGGVLAAGADPSGFEVAMLAGFGLSAAGDLCLLSRRQPVFLSGLLIFLVAHISYTTAFLFLGGEGWVVAIGLMGSGAVGAVVWRWLDQHVSGHMRVAVGVYIVAIATMLACAISAGAGSGSGSGWLVAGAASFVASDISVARDRFVKRDRLNLMWGPPLYFGAQWMFILGLLPS